MSEISKIETEKNTFRYYYNNRSAYYRGNTAFYVHVRFTLCLFKRNFFRNSLYDFYIRVCLLGHKRFETYYSQADKDVSDTAVGNVRFLDIHSFV